jgi:SsrA-binding protein
MAKAADKDPQKRYRLIAENRKARYNYTIDDTLEAGLMLVGTEVKSLRQGKADIVDAYGAEGQGELWLINAYIPEYAGGNRFNHETRRPRKLLLHKREVSRLIGTLKRGGVTLVPLSIYFNQRGRAKVQLALAHGKKLHDKRASEKARDWQRERHRLLKAGARE